MRPAVVLRVVSVAAFLASVGCGSHVEEAAETVAAADPVVVAKPVVAAKPVAAAAPVVADRDTASEWRWSDAKATLDYCMTQHLPDCEVKRTSLGDLCAVQLDIHRKSDGKRICGFESPTQAFLFARRDNVVYIADYSPNASGCFVSALDLDSGRKLWSTSLLGVEAVDQSKYRNRVNIDVNGENVVIFGNETNGRYVETLNAKTGALVSNKKL
jgi:hypothetical protein